MDEEFRCFSCGTKVYEQDLFYMRAIEEVSNTTKVQLSLKID